MGAEQSYECDDVGNLNVMDTTCGHSYGFCQEEQQIQVKSIHKILESPADADYIGNENQSRNRETHLDVMNPANIRENAPKLKLKEGMLSSQDELRVLDTSSGLGYRNRDFYIAKNRLTSTPKFSIEDTELGLEEIARAIYSLYIVSHHAQVTEDMAKISAIFNEPQKQNGHFELHHFRTYTITSPAFVYDMETRDHEIMLLAHEIDGFLKYLHQKLELEDQCYSYMLLYILRILKTGYVVLTKRNWRPIVLTALNLGAKFTHDYWYKNKDFSSLTELYSLRRINKYERNYLKLLEYRLYATPEALERLLEIPWHELAKNTVEITSLNLS